VYFATPTELQAQGARAIGKPVRLGGTVVPDSINMIPETLELRFAVADATDTIEVHQRIGQIKSILVLAPGECNS
jgi:cytochrome c-type biogenesis protein CcmE